MQFTVMFNSESETVLKCNTLRQLKKSSSLCIYVQHNIDCFDVVDNALAKCDYPRENWPSSYLVFL